MCRLLSAILEERSSRFKPPAPFKGGSDHLSTHSVEALSFVICHLSCVSP